jgi:hypothetical protein
VWPYPEKPYDAKTAILTMSKKFVTRNLAGNAIDFHVQVLGLSFHDTMRQITGA